MVFLRSPFGCLVFVAPIEKSHDYDIDHDADEQQQKEERDQPDKC